MTLNFGWLQSSPANFTRGRSASITDIAIHYTAGAQTAEGAAWANCKYFSGGSRDASAHYFIDDGPTIWQSVAEGDTAWAVSDWAGNCRSISIEVCTAGRFTDAELRTLSELVQYLMGKYGIPASRVKRHYDYNGKHCPAAYVDAGEWAALNCRITTLAKPEPPNPATKVEIWTYHGQGPQQWVVEPVDKGSDAVMLRNVASGKYLDVEGSADKDGTRIIAYPKNGDLNQQWRLRQAGGDVFASPVYIESALNGAMVCDVSGAGKTAGTGIILWTKHGNLNQQWLPVVVGYDKGNPIYIFLDANSGLALDVEGGK